jgi:RHS repeat-associated protein
MKLGYEDDGNYFDGNIRKQEWKSSIDNVTRSYTYSYDGALRITQGLYTSTKVGENYSLNSVSYDGNGNILGLSRNGFKSNNSFGLVDNLVYTYQLNSNKIQKVEDISNETASFTDASVNTDYTYWQDGSLKSDANKGITLIEYNYLKLPKKIVQNGITTLYQYDASGSKLKETIGTNITDYSGNKIYKNNILYQIGHEEGRISGGDYEYSIYDNLGNVRAMFRDSSGIAKPTQMENFGVWGESLSKINYYKNLSTKQNFIFTGHERNDDIGVYDAKARIYDPIVPRMWQIDRFSEKYSSYSNYNYSLCNPINVIDPTGNDVYFLIYDSNNYNPGDLLDALSTRKREIENGKDFNSKDDHIYTLDISDLGKLKDKVKESVTDAGKNKYGKTVEVSFFTHAGTDGPVGSMSVSGGNSQYNETGDNLDRNQLSLEGWREIDWNLNPEKNVICSYGCNSADWARNISTFENVQYAAGEDGRTGGTYSLDKWNAVWIPFWYENVYQRSAVGQDVLPFFIYRNGYEVSAPDKKPIRVNLSFDIINQTLKKTPEGPKK